jgi:tetratricopeptide (TPR) repeat protein
MMRMQICTFRGGTLDKYEYQLKLDQMKALTAENKYSAAAAIADTINWHKIKNVNALMKAGEIYENVGRYEESKEILLMAYDRSPIGRMILYRLTLVAVKMGAYEDAKEYYHEFVEIAPHDSLKYVLKYEINKAQGANLQSLISILEELKEQEYSEEWAYELAYLYHKAGMSEKCIDACDELILWFGDGPYVERALELKMLYQPLNKQQEEKYRQFRLQQSGVVEVTPDETLESGEIVNETVQIPGVKLSPERFNTQNLQEELQRSMQQIMDATEKETVDDSMDNIKKLVEEIPYLQLPKEETADGQRHIETDAEIDDSLKLDFKEFLAEDRDGQISLFMPEQGEPEPQITGQMSIEDVLAEWEKTRRAAEAALQAAEQRKLESAKARALQEAGDIMDRLADVIPKLDSGLTPRELLEEQYLAGQPIQEDKAAAMVANMNQILQQEIDRLSNENAKMDEQLAAAGSSNVLAEAVGIDPETAAYITGEGQTADELENEAMEDVASGMQELMAEAYTPEEEAVEIVAPEAEIATPEAEIAVPEAEQAEVSMPEISLPDEVEAISKEMSEASELPKISMPEGLEEELKEQEAKAVPEEKLPEISMPEDEETISSITKLTKEQREIFSYFVPIRGMEKQLCQAMTGVVRHLNQDATAATGNMIIQGGHGSGKTVLATSMIKVLQKETGKPKGKIGKIEASALNQKDAAALLEKVRGGCLIIENAGNLSEKVASQLSNLLEEDRSGIFVIIEDTRRGIEKVLAKDAGFTARFSEKITIPVFTIDELVEFAKSYANELGYTIDEMGVLALYNSISNIQKLDKATTLTEVKDIVDKAIAHAEKGGLKKAFSIIASRRYDEEDYVILHEKDFGF